MAALPGAGDSPLEDRSGTGGSPSQNRSLPAAVSASATPSRSPSACRTAAAGSHRQGFGVSGPCKFRMSARKTRIRAWTQVPPGGASGSPLTGPVRRCSSPASNSSEPSRRSRSACNCSSAGWRSRARSSQSVPPGRSPRPSQYSPSAWASRGPAGRGVTATIPGPRGNCPAAGEHLRPVLPLRQAQEGSGVALPGPSVPPARRAGPRRSGARCPAAGNEFRPLRVPRPPGIWTPAGRSSPARPAGRCHRIPRLPPPARKCRRTPIALQAPAAPRRIAGHTPVDRRPQRPVPRVSAGPGVGQEPEPVRQVRLDLRRRQRAQPRRGQLDRQRQPIQRRGRSAPPPPLAPPRAPAARRRPAVQNSRTAAAAPRRRMAAVSGGRSSGSTGQATSPGMPSGSRLVTSTRSPGAAAAAPRSAARTHPGHARSYPAPAAAPPTAAGRSAPRAPAVPGLPDPQRDTCGAPARVGDAGQLSQPHPVREPRDQPRPGLDAAGSCPVPPVPSA